MSFKNKQDYYGLSAISGLEIVSTSEGKTIQNKTAVGEDGFTIASLQYGERTTPSEECAVKGNVTLNTITLGTVTTVGQKKYALTSIAISTAAGSAPTFSADGQEVEATTTLSSCTVTLPTITLGGLHHAQDFSAFTISGTGAHLTSSNFSASVTLNPVEKDGVMLAHDIVNGVMTVTGTVVVSDSAYGVPVITPSTGWVLTAPLTETNPNSDFPSYAFTLTKYLAANA